ncbi:ZZ-type zinc finger-containing protein P35G2.11c-like isoform X2 [Dendronephthya gigantea]|uniref:ZZ-type zinc finger-containing protein P35G2.11c-like isoform X2 n=1 Tax=Dendronephthya gigantea TaxID=151771 RepID=UPI00106C4DA5|nr:ZZ-type zinc finger-containing protein P35G2.11c-like isoform X2 [Dendronephthya gigantea]
MSATHRLHPHHTGRTESDAVAVAQSTCVCSNCIKPLSQEPSFHCNQCDFIVCTTCDAPKVHPVHPNHPLYLVTPATPWRCNVCNSCNANSKNNLCYHCEICDFRMCKKCFPCMYSKLHVHPLLRTDVRLVYHQYNGEWNCDICGNSNGPGHWYPAHCQSCQFDLCDNCIKPYKSTYHQHPLYKADSKVTYPEYNGGWRCDRCLRDFQVNNNPFHCSQCGFDLCNNCMRTTGEISNTVGFDVPRMLNGGCKGFFFQM